MSNHHILSGMQMKFQVTKLLPTVANFRKIWGSGHHLATKVSIIVTDWNKFLLNQQTELPILSLAICTKMDLHCLGIS